MISTSCAKESLAPKHIVDTVLYRIKFMAENPDYFNPDGLVCFCGPQGSGKTISAVNYVYKLLEMYPNSILVSNIQLADYPIVTFEEFKEQNARLTEKVCIRCRDSVFPDMVGKPLDEAVFCSSEEYEDFKKRVEYVRKMADEIMYELYLRNNKVFPFIDNDDLARYENDQRGVIFLIDEIQLYMNSLKSNNINMDTMTQISQQRKQRKHIVATSQVFGRMAKPLREQFSCVVVCKSYFGKLLQYNRMIDRDSIDESTDDAHVTGEVKHRFIWFHSPAMYKKYDTYYVIERGKFVANEEKKGDIYSDDHIVQLPANN